MTHIPQFPDFVRLSLSHKDLLRTVTKQFPPYSDFNFVSLYAWDTDEILGVALLHDNLIVRFSDYESDKIFLSLLGTNKLSDTLRTLFQYCRDKHLPEILELVPHTVVKQIDSSLLDEYELKEDRNNHDYIISVKNLSSGNTSRNKRRSYAHFIRKCNNEAKCRLLNLGTSEDRHRIEGVLASWKEAKTLTQENKKEFTAIDRCLRHAEELDVQAYGTFIKNRLVSFVIFEVLSGRTAMLHFGKSDYGLPGAFDYMKIELARYFDALHIEYMNFEQDVGIEGLRADKEAYKPVKFLKKYTIEEKT